MPRSALPEDLGDHFAVGVARAVGVPRSRLRAADLKKTFHAARSVTGAAVDEPRRTYAWSAEVRRIHARTAEYEPVMAQTAFFSHITAAVLWGAPLPNRILAAPPVGAEPRHPVFDPEILQVSMMWPSRAPRGRGVDGHAVRPAMTSTGRHPESRLRLTSPATTWAMLGGSLPHRYDLVAVADYFCRVARAPGGLPGRAVAPPLATIGQLEAALAAGRRAGAAELREALGRVRTGASSRTETWTRLTLVDAGLPEPLLDVDVFDDTGRFLACVDMAYPRWRIAVEYEGTHHSSGTQWESDVDRYAGLEAAGWRVIRVTRSTLFRTPATLVSRVRGAIADRAV